MSHNSGERFAYEITRILLHLNLVSVSNSFRVAEIKNSEVKK